MNTKSLNSLKNWFTLHFVVDYLFALPLLIAPAFTLELLDFEAESFVTARLVAAALMGIGGVSLWARDAGKESYRSLLRLKLLWSWSAILALILSIIEGAPVMTWGLLGIFVLFSGLWSYYYFLRLD